MEFIDRYFDEADNDSISSTIAGQRTSEYVSGLIEKYPVEDVKGNLKYLTVSNEDTDTESDGE